MLMIYTFAADDGPHFLVQVSLSTREHTKWTWQHLWNTWIGDVLGQDLSSDCGVGSVRATRKHVGMEQSLVNDRWV